MTLLPGATLDPGVHWNYQAGYSSCLMEVLHYTVGRDSRALIRNNGLAALLIWDDVIWEMAPLDAVCFTECEWNRRSIGYEVESLDGSITDKQIANLGYATLFTLVTFGIPMVFYDGPRMPVGYDYRGVTNHRNLIHNACDMHSDGFDQWVWDAMFAAPPPAPLPLEDAMWLIYDTATLNNWLATANGMILVPNDQVLDLVAAGIKRYDVDTRTVQWLGQNLKP